jgi:hypothetical protein
MFHLYKEEIMKFIVDNIKEIEEKDGFKYIGIFDSNEKDWYEELKKFKKDTLKIMYNKDTHLVLSTHTDASMLAPTMAGDVVEEIKYQEVQVNPNLYFVDGKLIELQRYETVENGKVVFNKNLRIDEIKKELQDLKDKKIQLGVKIKEGLYHPVRDTDKVNLMIAKNSWSGTRKWKFYDEEGNGAIDDITLEIINKIFSDGEKVLNGAILGETEAENALSKMTDKELKELDVKEYFESYYKKAGGI